MTTELNQIKNKFSSFADFKNWQICVFRWLRKNTYFTDDMVKQPLKRKTSGGPLSFIAYFFSVFTHY